MSIMKYNQGTCLRKGYKIYEQARSVLTCNATLFIIHAQPSLATYAESVLLTPCSYWNQAYLFLAKM